MLSPEQARKNAAKAAAAALVFERRKKEDWKDSSPELDPQSSSQNTVAGAGKEKHS